MNATHAYVMLYTPIDVILTCNIRKGLQIIDSTMYFVIDSFDTNDLHIRIANFANWLAQAF